VKGVPRPISIREISSLQLKRCFRKGFQFSVLQEFEYLFQEIPGLPPNREINFSIDLVLGDAPVSKKPYRMSTP
jgi:hypothetical protein